MRFEGTSGQWFGEMEAEIVRLKMQRNGLEIERDSLKRCCDELESRLAALEAFAEKVRVNGEPVRDSVLAFACDMERRLRANDHKGGWQDCGLFQLHDRLFDEWRELFVAIRTEENIVGEAADVANFAMMIADLAAHDAAKKEGE